MGMGELQLDIYAQVNVLHALTWEKNNEREASL